MIRASNQSVNYTLYALTHGMFPSLNVIPTHRLCALSVPGWQLGEGLTLDHSILGCLRLPLNGIKSCRTGRKFVKQRHTAKVFCCDPEHRLPFLMSSFPGGNVETASDRDLMQNRQSESAEVGGGGFITLKWYRESAKKHSL